ncbi:hypothetical protein [Streptomyces sp. bgisy091]|uniref:hypothetical protein n=1 Tax=Streptomyces sp. bgisy091 TaxID=3413778 RepID=UPI003D70FA51
MATQGRTSRRPPPVFGASWQTVQRRFTYWSQARVWAKPYRVVRDRFGANGGVDQSRCAVDSAGARAVGGGP